MTKDLNIIGISGLHNSLNFKKQKFPQLSFREHLMCQGHNSAAALINSSGIVAAAAEERFVRKKGTGQFPFHAINYCLQEQKLRIEDIDFIASSFNYEPYRTAYSLLESYNQVQFQEVYSREIQLKTLFDFFPFVDWQKKFVQVPHHLAHAASTYYLSGAKEALIMVCDGMGEAHSLTVAIGQGNEIHIIKQFPALHSMGILYGLITHFLGFDMSFDEYKVMGLAPYGNPQNTYERFMELVKLGEKGTYTIPFLLANKTTLEKETFKNSLQILSSLFGEARNPNTNITKRDMDVAAGMQLTLQTVLIHVLKYFEDSTKEKKLCMAGGVALNCVLNKAIQEKFEFEEIFIQPASGDDGSALGAALFHQIKQNPTQLHKKMGMPFWGPKFPSDSMPKLLEEYGFYDYIHCNDFNELLELVAILISNGKVVGWFQDRMEFGPRALGNRSILADPRFSRMKEHINSIIKNRENFRPFAPAVPIEKAHIFFDLKKENQTPYKYMLITANVKNAYKDVLKAVTHIDNSARVQVVCQKDNNKFWQLLNAFEKVTGLPVLLNTSFNIAGQPIVCTPKDAIETFLNSKIDNLVVGCYILSPKITTLANSKNVTKFIVQPKYL